MRLTTVFSLAFLLACSDPNDPGDPLPLTPESVEGTWVKIQVVRATVTDPILSDTTDQRVRGLTTAASIWIVAGLGMACGAGHWRTALVASAFTLLVLVAGHRIEQLLAAPFHEAEPGTLEQSAHPGPGPVASRRWGARRPRVS